MKVVARMGALAAAGLAGLAIATAGVTPAQAAPTAPAGLLTLVVAPDAATDGATRMALLQCSPDTGTHPTVSAACDALRVVSGDLTALGTDEGFCTREYQPVSVTAVGVWNNAPVVYRQTFSNRCEMLKATGQVFSF